MGVFFAGLFGFGLIAERPIVKGRLRQILTVFFWGGGGGAYV